MTLRELFISMRRAQGIKQGLVASQAGIAQPSLAKFEKGRATLSTRTLTRRAPITNLNPA
jgi:transcriptional regulator with XRE-family HTH domain